MFAFDTDVALNRRSSIVDKAKWVYVWGIDGTVLYYIFIVCTVYWICSTTYKTHSTHTTPIVYGIHVTKKNPKREPSMDPDVRVSMHSHVILRSSHRLCHSMLSSFSLLSLEARIVRTAKNEGKKNEEKTVIFPRHFLLFFGLVNLYSSLHSTRCCWTGANGNDTKKEKRRNACWCAAAAVER